MTKDEFLALPKEQQYAIYQEYKKTQGVSEEQTNTEQPKTVTHFIRGGTPVQVAAEEGPTFDMSRVPQNLRKVQSTARGYTKIPFTEMSPIPAPENQTAEERAFEFGGEVASPIGGAIAKGVGKVGEKLIEARKYIPGYGKLEKWAKGFTMKQMTNHQNGIQNAGVDFMTSKAHGGTFTDKADELVNFAKEKNIPLHDAKEMSLASEKLVEDTGEEIASIMKQTAEELKTNKNAIKGMLPESGGQFLTKRIVDDVMKEVENVTSDSNIIQKVQQKLVNIAKDPTMTLDKLWETRKEFDSLINYKSIKAALRKGENLTDTQSAFLAGRNGLQKRITDTVDAISGTPSAEALKAANLNYQKALALDAMGDLRERSEYMGDLDWASLKKIYGAGGRFITGSLTSKKTPQIAGGIAEATTRLGLPTAKIQPGMSIQDQLGQEIQQ